MFFHSSPFNISAFQRTTASKSIQLTHMQNVTKESTLSQRAYLHKAMTSTEQIQPKERAD